jgi:predicted HicB family RNase H-like nuclease
VLRFPKSLAEDLAEISAKSGLSMNAICIHLLRSAVKQKLKEVKE